MPQKTLKQRIVTIVNRNSKPLTVAQITAKLHTADRRNFDLLTPEASIRGRTYELANAGQIRRYDLGTPEKGSTFKFGRELAETRVSNKNTTTTVSGGEAQRSTPAPTPAPRSFSGCGGGSSYGGSF